MNEKAQSTARKWLGVAAAIALYYLVHEGSHLIAALGYGAFRGVRLLGPGMQVMVDAHALSDVQMGVFCAAGPLMTLVAAYALTLLAERIARCRSKIVRAVSYYGTIALLLLDPVYLAVLYRFFGGGDMNGIVLLGVPEIAVQALFALIGLANAVLLVRRVTPAYARSFGKA